MAVLLQILLQIKGMVSGLSAVISECSFLKFDTYVFYYLSCAFKNFLLAHFSIAKYVLSSQSIGCEHAAHLYSILWRQAWLFDWDD